MKPLGKAHLGAITFCASCHKNEECGINGLPLTPNSIRILGCFQQLTSFDHPNLSLYLDLVRGKHGMFPWIINLIKFTPYINILIIQYDVTDAL